MDSARARGQCDEDMAIELDLAVRDAGKKGARMKVGVMVKCCVSLSMEVRLMRTWWMWLGIGVRGVGEMRRK